MAEIDMERRPRRGVGKWIVLLLVIAAVAVGAWLVLRGDGEAGIDLDPSPAPEASFEPAPASEAATAPEPVTEPDAPDQEQPGA